MLLLSWERIKYSSFSSLNSHSLALVSGFLSHPPHSCRPFTSISPPHPIPQSRRVVAVMYVIPLPVQSRREVVIYYLPLTPKSPCCMLPPSRVVVSYVTSPDPKSSSRGELRWASSAFVLWCTDSGSLPRGKNFNCRKQVPKAYKSQIMSCDIKHPKVSHWRLIFKQILQWRGKNKLLYNNSKFYLLNIKGKHHKI